MRFNKSKSLLAITLSAALSCPAPLMAAQPVASVAPAQTVVVDGLKINKTVSNVALQDNVLQGALVDANGQAIAEATVVLSRMDEVIDQQVTDAEGRYAFENVQAGHYQVRSAAGMELVRTWEADSAPNGAKQGIIQTVDRDMARGRFGHYGLSTCQKILIGGVIAAAIAIPIAVSNDDDDAS
ncbi:hypothetical protein FF011L_47920 [Roseimaritima multifibrata]|uniref:Cna protein B-type domain protein n=1 Tax=Roseimaritima multifibrata TaxID=1930274 RepID=A0A517MM76_9BACT|nr:carboxypeptidase regulatory-like domain-containing protein [Roseimaritima multifibrata]QDS95988.1 hypothetical protein FF011L_47920 [Roseimaritima multifibrata]